MKKKIIILIAVTLILCVGAGIAAAVTALRKAREPAEPLELHRPQLVIETVSPTKPQMEQKNTAAAADEPVETAEPNDERSAVSTEKPAATMMPSNAAPQPTPTYLPTPTLQLSPQPTPVPEETPMPTASPELSVTSPEVTEEPSDPADQGEPDEGEGISF